MLKRFVSAVCFILAAAQAASPRGACRKSPVPCSWINNLMNDISKRLQMNAATL